MPRDKVIIASKWGPAVVDGQFGYKATAKDARECLEGQLQRLGVDYLDLWILRSNMHGVGILEESITAMKVPRHCINMIHHAHMYFTMSFMMPAES